MHNCCYLSLDISFNLNVQTNYCYFLRGVENGENHPIFSTLLRLEIKY